jgi:formylglycine-generating enzyme required for sulfatase activity
MKRIFCLMAVLLVLTSSFSIQAQQKEPPKNFTNGIGMKFVWIPPGTFQMGSPKEEEGRRDNETQHKVTLTKGFYLGTYLVTQEQWQAVMGNNPSIGKGGKNLPVENVSWEDCQGFLQNMRKGKDHGYRLPTEAEWEYACRAGTTTPSHFGQAISLDRANFNGNYPIGKGKIGIAHKTTTPVGSFPSNKWGIYDMHVNVWEWCADIYEEYPVTAVVDPNNTVFKPLPRASKYILQLSSTKFAERQSATNALNEIGLPALPELRKVLGEAPDLETRRRVEQLVARIAKNGDIHVLRGGSFVDPASVVRSAYRVKFESTYRNFDVGFRVVRIWTAE